MPRPGAQQRDFAYSGSTLLAQLGFAAAWHVDAERFAGTCHRAANGRFLGQTQGRGKLGPRGRQRVSIKNLWVYPLGTHFRDHLTR